MNPVRGSGLAAATTITSWSALATTARSTGSVSSALRRRRVWRSWIFTRRASVSGAPDTSPTSETKSPATTGDRRSSRARAAMTMRSLSESSPTTAVYRPRSTVMIRPVTASSWLGRSLVRGREPFLLGRIRTSDSSQESVLRATATLFRPQYLGSSLGQHAGPQLREVGHGLGGSGDVVHLDAAYREAQDCPGSGHAVVGVAVDDAGVQRGWPDDQAVAGFLGVAAEPVDLGDQRGEPVSFVPAKVGDSAEPGRPRGKGTECRDRRSQFTGVGEVAALDFWAAGDGQESVLQGDRGSHPGEDAAPEVAHLLRFRGPVGNADGALRCQCRCQERPSVGEVLFDSLVEGLDGSRGHHPVVGDRIVHGDAGAAEDSHRHVDVVQAWHRFPDVLKVQAVVEPCSHQQEGGDKLRGGAGINHQVAAPDRAGPFHHEGKGRRRAPVLGGNRDAQGFEGFDDGSHGTLPGVRIAVEHAGSAAERRKWWDEPHDGAGQPAVDPGGGWRR